MAGLEEQVVARAAARLQYLDRAQRETQVAVAHFTLQGDVDDALLPPLWLASVLGRTTITQTDNTT
jgi:hypothetical protein